jgi:hypothetical protein
MDTPSFIEFDQSSLTEECDHSDSDDSTRDDLDMDTDMQVSTETEATKQQLEGMKNAIREANMNPMLLSNYFELSSHSLLKSAVPMAAALDVNKSRAFDNELNVQEPKRRRHSALEQTLNLVFDGDIGPASMNRDLQAMKAMVKQVKSNPSLIYQKFDLPWMVGDLTEDHQPKHLELTRAGCAGVQFPSSPLPVVRRVSQEDEPPRMEPCLGRRPTFDFTSAGCAGMQFPRLPLPFVRRARREEDPMPRIEQSLSRRPTFGCFD